ncbi:hypothetical protein NC651_006223 [Populus alba x Populus x berolinensis]|nr:hypothetical protein NC651_004678 [Populus alba x Populus x berolinensis]KAJ6939993.1 hypothetical protein NC651_006223 [Populus alba x Populus x berolinensis]
MLSSFILLSSLSLVPLRIMECVTFIDVAEDWGFEFLLCFLLLVWSLHDTTVLLIVSLNGSAIYDVSSRQSLFSTIIEEQPLLL